MSKKGDNLTLKIFALVIAIVLWGFVMIEVNPDDPQTIKNISVSFNNLDALERNRLVLMDPKEATTSVRVVGKKTDMLDFSHKSIKAYVDLSGYGEGQVKVPIKVLLEESGKVRIEKWDPDYVLFTFDRLISIDKPVTINTIGSLEPNYVLGDPTTKSQFIQLKGPRTYVNEVSKIIAVVNVDGRTDNMNVTAPIKLVDDQGNDVIGVTAEPSIIDVSIPVYRTVTVPIELQTEVPENYEITNISIKPNRVTLKGDKSIANLTSVLTKPIDIDVLMANENIPVELDLPANVTLLNPKEKITASLSVQEAFTKTFEFTIEEIEIIGLDEGLSIDDEMIYENIKIEVKGREEDIDILTKEDIEVYINLSIYEEGEHTVYVGVNLPENLAIKSITPQPMNINIIRH